MVFSSIFFLFFHFCLLFDDGNKGKCQFAGTTCCCVPLAPLFWFQKFSPTKYFYSARYFIRYAPFPLTYPQKRNVNDVTIIPTSLKLNLRKINDKVKCGTGFVVLSASLFHNLQFTEILCGSKIQQQKSRWQQFMNQIDQRSNQKKENPMTECVHGLKRTKTLCLCADSL